MIKQNSKPSISEYRFLSLLTSTIVLQGKSPIFENQQLQNDLYDFYDNANFHFLFEDICKKESIEGNNYVDLGDAFQTAYTWGLLSMIQDNSNLKSLINFSREEAQKTISQFDQYQVKTMNELVTHLYESRVNKHPILTKSINIHAN